MLTALILSGCNNSTTTSDDAGTIGIQLPVSSDRAVLPTQSDVASYVITVTGLTNGHVVTKTGLPGDYIMISDLPVSDYTVEVKGLNALGNTLFIGSENTQLIAGQNVFVNVPLGYNGGSLDIGVTFPANIQPVIEDWRYTGYASPWVNCVVEYNINGIISKSVISHPTNGVTITETWDFDVDGKRTGSTIVSDESGSPAVKSTSVVTHNTYGNEISIVYSDSLGNLIESYESVYDMTNAYITETVVKDSTGLEKTARFYNDKGEHIGYRTKGTIWGEARVYALKAGYTTQKVISEYFPGTRLIKKVEHYYDEYLTDYEIFTLGGNGFYDSSKHYDRDGLLIGIGDYEAPKQFDNFYLQTYNQYKKNTGGSNYIDYNTGDTSHNPVNYVGSHSYTREIRPDSYYEGRFENWEKGTRNTGIIITTHF